ncbi:MAG: vitamin K epoxide reductase family protein [Candidatus Paceibacterota bacterium]
MLINIHMDRYLIITILAVLGFSVAAYIQYKKSRRERLVCYLGDDCNKVVFSRYSTLLGIPNEVLGLTYFSAVAVSSAVLMVAPDMNTDFTKNIFRSVVSVAALFSLILILIQIFKLKELCEWCLSTAVFSVLIALLVLF